MGLETRADLLKPHTNSLYRGCCVRFAAAHQSRFEERIVVGEPSDLLQFLVDPLTVPFPDELAGWHHNVTAALEALVSEFQPDGQFRLVEQLNCARFTDRYVWGASRLAETSGCDN